MSDELVEALSLRLAEVRIAEMNLIEESFKNNPDRMPSRALLSIDKAVASECLRQMEYARRCVGISGPTTVETASARTISPAETYLPALRLAPPDWKP